MNTQFPSHTSRASQSNQTLETLQKVMEKVNAQIQAISMKICNDFSVESFPNFSNVFEPKFLLHQGNNFIKRLDTNVNHFLVWDTDNSQENDDDKTITAKLQSVLNKNVFTNNKAPIQFDYLDQKGQDYTGYYPLFSEDGIFVYYFDMQYLQMVNILDYSTLSNKNHHYVLLCDLTRRDRGKFLYMKWILIDQMMVMFFQNTMVVLERIGKSFEIVFEFETKENIGFENCNLVNTISPNEFCILIANGRLLKFVANPDFVLHSDTNIIPVNCNPTNILIQKSLELDNRGLFTVLANGNLTVFLQNTPILWTCGLYNVLDPQSSSRQFFADHNIEDVVFHCPTRTLCVLHQKQTISFWDLSKLFDFVFPDSQATMETLQNEEDNENVVMSNPIKSYSEAVQLKGTFLYDGHNLEFLDSLDIENNIWILATLKNVNTNILMQTYKISSDGNASKVQYESNPNTFKSQEVLKFDMNVLRIDEQCKVNIENPNVNKKIKLAIALDKTQYKIVHKKITTAWDNLSLLKAYSHNSYFARNKTLDLCFTGNKALDSNENDNFEMSDFCGDFVFETLKVSEESAVNLFELSVSHEIQLPHEKVLENELIRRFEFGGNNYTSENLVSIDPRREFLVSLLSKTTFPTLHILKFYNFNTGLPVKEHKLENHGNRPVKVAWSHPDLIFVLYEKALGIMLMERQEFNIKTQSQIQFSKSNVNFNEKSMVFVENINMQVEIKKDTKTIKIFDTGLTCLNFEYNEKAHKLLSMYLTPEQFKQRQLYPVIPLNNKNQTYKILNIRNNYFALLYADSVGLVKIENGGAIKKFWSNTCSLHKIEPIDFLVLNGSYLIVLYNNGIICSWELSNALWDNENNTKLPVLMDYLHIGSNYKKLAFITNNQFLIFSNDYSLKIQLYQNKLQILEKFKNAFENYELTNLKIQSQNKC